MTFTNFLNSPSKRSEPLTQCSLLARRPFSLPSRVQRRLPAPLPDKSLSQTSELYTASPLNTSFPLPFPGDWWKALLVPRRTQMRPVQPTTPWGHVALPAIVALCCVPALMTSLEGTWGGQMMRQGRPTTAGWGRDCDVWRCYALIWA